MGPEVAVLNRLVRWCLVVARGFAKLVGLTLGQEPKLRLS